MFNFEKGPNYPTEDYTDFKEKHRELPEKFDLSQRDIIIPEKVLQLFKDKKNKDITEFLNGTSGLPYRTKIYSSYPGNLYLFFEGVKEPNNLLADLQIARLEFDPNSGRVSGLTRTVSSRIFIASLAEFPENSFWGQIRKILNIPNPSPEDIAAKEKLIIESRKIELTLEELLKLSSEKIFSGFLIEDKNNTRQIHIVHQGEYSVAKSDEIRYLATFGAVDCIILAIYDPLNKTGALAHIDGITDEISTVRAMKDALRNATQIQVTILGGTSISVRQVIELYREILSWQRKLRLDVKIGPVLTGTPQSLALDLSTGEIRRFIVNASIHQKDAPIEELSVLSRILGMYQRGKKRTAKFSPPKVSEE